MEKIGNMLKEKRIELGMSVEDISEKTRLTTKHIKALEEGDISFFHEDLSYLRFFVKSYCDAVGIDFEDMKDELRESIDDYTMTSVQSAQLSQDVYKRQHLCRNGSRSDCPSMFSLSRTFCCLALFKRCST